MVFTVGQPEGAWAPLQSGRCDGVSWFTVETCFSAVSISTTYRYGLSAR